MTYGQFHLVFNLPVLIVLLLLNAGIPCSGMEFVAAGAVLAVVMIFTSPWDNWAVKRGIWGFPQGRYWRKIAYLPVEEYLFFIWQTVLVMLSVRWFLGAHPWARSHFETAIGLREGGLVGAVLLIWILLGWRTRWRSPLPQGNYAWHLLFWFGPVIVMQWALAWELLAHLWPVIVGVTIAWGSYYTVADWIAVRQGIWFFDERQITGHKLGGILPWEEIAFFYLTSLLVAQSYVLLLPAPLR